MDWTVCNTGRESDLHIHAVKTYAEAVDALDAQASCEKRLRRMTQKPLYFKESEGVLLKREQEGVDM